MWQNPWERKTIKNSRDQYTGRSSTEQRGRPGVTERGFGPSFDPGWGARWILVSTHPPLDQKSLMSLQAQIIKAKSFLALGEKPKSSVSSLKQRRSPAYSCSYIWKTETKDWREPALGLPHRRETVSSLLPQNRLIFTTFLMQKLSVSDTRA